MYLIKIYNSNLKLNDNLKDKKLGHSVLWKEIDFLPTLDWSYCIN